MQRNWGSVLVRLGETADPELQASFYENAVERFKPVISFYDPHIQANEYAQANQNFCVAQVRLGAIQFSLERLKDAKASCLKALEATDPANNVIIYTMATNSLAVTYALMAGLSKLDEDFEHAISTFVSAQSLQEKDQAPLHWASVETNLGQLHCEWSNERKDIAKLQRAVEYKQSALQVFLALSADLYATATEKQILQYQLCLNDKSEICQCE